MTNERYGKSIENIIEIKNDFFEQNEKMLKKNTKIANILREQPERKKCKICGEKLEEQPIMNSHNIEYYLCSKCNHLNSKFEDTETFAYKVYIDDDYYYNYTAENKNKYEERRDHIYIPKVEFLIESLEHENIKLDNINLLDIGAGSGYFVSAAKKLGIRSEGIEISPKQVEFGNSMSDENILMQIDSEYITTYIENGKYNIISAIGVFEHIIDLNKTLNAIKRNNNIKYVYVSVPMFSFSCIFEAVYQECFNRQLGGTHTHLFSDKSLNYLADKMGFEIVSSWKFGSDIMDLYRFIYVSLEKNNNNKLKEYFKKQFIPLIDNLQEVIDKSEFTSEVHLLLKRKK